MNKEYCVYVHTNKANGKKYVGITRQKPKDRWRGGSAYKYNEYFYKAIKKYGWDGFTHEVLITGLTQEEACRCEVALIAQYDSANKRNGYNVSYGGEGHVSYSPQMREKMSRSARMRNQDPIKFKNICAGNCRRWEREGEREKITKGLNSYYSRNPDRRMQISEERKRFFAEHPEKKTTRAIVQLTMDGEFVKRWDSITEAANSMGVDMRNIYSSCSGRVKSSHGYIWKYLSET